MFLLGYRLAVADGTHRPFSIAKWLSRWSMLNAFCTKAPLLSIAHRLKKRSGLFFSIEIPIEKNN
jgi:hypothetical protein